MNDSFSKVAEEENCRTRIWKTRNIFSQLFEFAWSYSLFVWCSITRFAVSSRWEREVAENGPVKDFHRFCCCCCRRLGNMFVLCERPDGSPIVIAGPCWPFCMFVTLPLILAVAGAVAYFVIISKDSPLVSSG